MLDAYIYDGIRSPIGRHAGALSGLRPDDLAGEVIAEVVKRNPDHFGVLSGYGQIYVQLDQPERALDYFQRALKVNPNLRQVEAAVEQLKRLIIEKRKGTI